MLAIKLFRQDEFLLNFQSDKKLIRIGRGSSCDLMLPDSSLSRTHCVLIQKDGVWSLEDDSKNGTHSTTEAILQARVRVREGERYKMGRLFSFEIDSSPSTKELEEKTILTHRESTKLLGVDPSSQQLVIGQAEISGVTDNGDVLSKLVPAAGLSIGSHSSNDIVLHSQALSQFHARVDLIRNEYILSDCGSTNGSIVNGLKVVRATLPDEATIHCGPFSFQFKIKKTSVAIEPKASSQFLGMVSNHRTMKKIFSMIEVVAGSDAAVFVQGETGTGKELVARALHSLSQRYQAPFLAINCAALPKELIESELFGHEKGAFTGATHLREGAFEMAHNGTLFLDEIAELDFDLQAKLLRTLETGEIKRVGASKSKTVSVRIVSATHKNLLSEVAAGRFREDLFYRLHIIPVELPPLRERIDDLDLLIPFLLQQMKLDFEIDADAITSLKGYRFPGNIRELKNILQRAAIEYQLAHLERGSSKSRAILRPKHFSFLDGLALVQSPKSPEKIREREEMLQALKSNRYNQSDAARSLGIPISTFHDRAKKYGLQKDCA